MFTWMHGENTPGRSGPGAGNSAGPLADDAELDALVDDELDDQRRRQYLQRIESEPAGWRRVGIRFLQRQVERRAVREWMGASVVKKREEPRGIAYRLYPALRVAAMLMIVAGAAGLFMSRRQSPTAAVIKPQPAVPIARTLAADSARHHIHFFNAPVSQVLGGNYMPGPISNGANIRQAAHRVLLVPRGSNRIMAYPIVPVNAGDRPIY